VGSRAEELLLVGARDLGLELAPVQVEAFCLYARELKRWNERFNLTGLREERKVFTRLILTSLAFSVAFPSPLPRRMVDVGTGAGLPGLPLKIAFPFLQITLVEATRKKASFLHHISAYLGLEGVEVLQTRAEDLIGQAEFRERFDVGVARAVGKRELLLRIMTGLVRPGGRVIFSGGGEEEQPPAEGGALSFLQHRKVGFPSLGLEMKLLVWERKG